MSVFVQALRADNAGHESPLHLVPIEHGSSTAPLAAGDRVAVTARADAATFLYVIHYDRKSSPRLLFPDHGDKQVQRGITIRVPAAGQYLVLDGDPSGDFIVVVATRAPMDTADPKLRARLHLTGRRAYNPPPVGGGPKGRGDGVSLRADDHGIAIGRVFLARANGRTQR